MRVQLFLVTLINEYVSYLTRLMAQVQCLAHEVGLMVTHPFLLSSSNTTVRWVVFLNLMQQGLHQKQHKLTTILMGGPIIGIQSLFKLE